MKKFGYYNILSKISVNNRASQCPERTAQCISENKSYAYLMLTAEHNKIVNQIRAKGEKQC